MSASWVRRAALMMWMFSILLPMVVNSAPPSGEKPVVLMEVKGVIGHAVNNYVERGIRRAERTGAPCAVIAIDTPGGLMESMKEIATAMINAKVPVVVYVYPNGSTATSAGFFILMASDVAAMAPDTSTGSAHPVDMGGGKMDKTMKEKTTNYAIKYMEQLVERRGRNGDVGRRAVLRSISVTAEEALSRNVIEIIARSVPELLAKLDGRVIVKGGPRTLDVRLAGAAPELRTALERRGLAKTGDAEATVNLEKADVELRKLLRKNGLLKNEGRRFVLKTKGAPIEKIDMSFREKFFQTVGHPNIAYILFMVGVYGIIFEVTHPGTIAPGVIGAVCLIIAFTAFQVIPINTIGLLMIVGAFVLFLLEIKVVSHGLLTAGGIALMVFGSLMLVDSADPVMRINVWLILSTTGTTAAIIVVALAAVIATHRRKVVTGAQGMIGMHGKTVTAVGAEGKIIVRGEYWNARSASGESIAEGENVEITALDGMTAVVRKK